MISKLNIISLKMIHRSS